MRFALIHLYVYLILQMLLTGTFAEGSELSIIYTGDLQGQLEPCGCSPKSDYGGIARVAGFIAAHEEELSPYILLDAGNFSDRDTPQGRLKTESMLKFLSLMKYDAVAFSQKERDLPGDYLHPLLKKYNVPFVSGFSGYAESVALSKNTLNINVSADPESSQNGKLNILLTELPVSDTKKMKKWDVIITSSGEELEEPLSIDDMVIVSGYTKGKRIGILTLQINDKDGFNYTHRSQPTGNEIKRNAMARKMLDDYDAKVAALLRDAEKPLPGTTYTGIARCAECHQPFMEKWESSRHASAFASLEEVGKSADPECIVCHVVGFGEEGGFFSIETTPELANVQCEACHGLNRQHLSDFSPMGPVTEKVCRKCHTRENSPEFDYPVYLEKIKH
jgi:2',3'-cyclic-nucleotide 2'-phosphodiesterase (5'-nucleotidase family)